MFHVRQHFGPYFWSIGKPSIGPTLRVLSDEFTRCIRDNWANVFYVCWPARAELVKLKFRQLRRAIHNFVADQQRRIDLGISMLVGVQIEHELSDRTLESG